MAIVRFDPYRLLPSSLWRWPSLLDEDWLGEESEGLEVYETDNDVVVKAHVAGVPADRVEVSVEGGTVTIKAEHEESEEEKQKKKVVYRSARKTRYLYTTSLPASVDAQAAEAKVEDGVLTLTLPKKEEAKPKKITVKAAGK